MIGVEDSMFVLWTGYASGVVNDGLIPYGPFTTHMINYTFDAGNGFSAFIGVEEGSTGDSAFDLGEGIIQDYTPHVLGGVAWKGGLFGASAVVAYDFVQEEFAVKGRLDVTPSEVFSLFVMGAWTDDDGGGSSVVVGTVDPVTGLFVGVPFSDNGGNYYATWGGDWAVWAGGAWNINDRLTLNGEFGYNELGDYSVVVDAQRHRRSGLRRDAWHRLQALRLRRRPVCRRRRTVGRLPPHPVHLLIGFRANQRSPRPLGRGLCLFCDTACVL